MAAQANESRKRMLDVNLDLRDDIAVKRPKNVECDGKITNQLHDADNLDSSGSQFEEFDFDIAAEDFDIPIVPTVEANDLLPQTSFDLLADGSEPTRTSESNRIATEDIPNCELNSRNSVRGDGPNPDDDSENPSQSFSHASTPGLSTAAPSRGNSSAPGVQTPVSLEDQINAGTSASNKYLPGQGLMRALQSKHLPDDFLEKFRSAYPGYLDRPEDDHVEENSTDSTSEAEPIQVRVRRSRIEVDRPPFSCPSGCPGSFELAAPFREHLETKHSDEYKLCKHADCVKYVHVSEETKMLLVWHYKQDHRQNVLRCTEHPNCNFKPTFNEKSYVEHIRSHKLRCHFCLDEKKRALPFGTADALKAHIKTMHTEKSFPCQGYDFVTGKPCERRFPTEGGRTKHMGCAHRGQYLCPYCPTDTEKVDLHETERALATHIRAEHRSEYSPEWKAKAGEKDHLCPHCGKKMSKGSNLRTHIATQHAGERRWKCNESELVGSARMVDDDENELPWDHATAGCDAAFANKQTLIDHVRSVHFGLLRWEALKNLRSGQAMRLVGPRKEKQNKKRTTSASRVLSGLDTDAWT